MPEENLEEQSTILDDSPETDYSEQESAEIEDYSEDTEPEKESDETESEEQEDVETEEAEEAEDDLPNDPVALKELAKKLREEAKAHQAAFTKKAQEAAELKKIKEQEAIKAEETEIVQLDTEVKTIYEQRLALNTQAKNNDLNLLKEAYTNGTAVTWFDGQVYEVNDSNYDQMKEFVIEMRLNERIALDHLKDKANAQVNSKKVEKISKDRERFYTEFEQNTADRIAKLPELKDVIDVLKETADPDAEFATSILDKFESMVEKAVARTITQRQEKAENSKAKAKASGAVTAASGVPKSKPKNGYSIEDILAMDDSEIRKL